MKHTSAPWIVNYHKGYKQWNIFPKNQYPRVAIASVYGDGSRPCDEDDANARLIAAAPDLLDALDSLARYADECELILRDTHPGKAGYLNDRVKKAIATIAKATGETQ